MHSHHLNRQPHRAWALCTRRFIRGDGYFKTYGTEGGVGFFVFFGAINIELLFFWYRGGTVALDKFMHFLLSLPRVPKDVVSLHSTREHQAKALTTHLSSIQCCHSCGHRVILVRIQKQWLIPSTHIFSNAMGVLTRPRSLRHLWVWKIILY
jgi:hypothetical protein